MVITSKTRNIRPSFLLKDNKTCVTCEGDCSCGSLYIGETKHTAEVRWSEHNNPTKSSKPSKHLRSNINHYFKWAVISNAQKKKGKKMPRPVKSWKHHILLSGNLILINKGTLKD